MTDETMNTVLDSAQEAHDVATRYMARLQNEAFQFRVEASHKDALAGRMAEQLSCDLVGHEAPTPMPADKDGASS